MVSHKIVLMFGVSCVLLLHANLASADSFYFDGSYSPDAPMPPAGQSVWDVFTGPGASIVPNSPVAGQTTFMDSLTNADDRVAMSNAFIDPLFLATPSTQEWSYAMRIQLDSLTAGLANVFGARDEGGNGKTILLGWSDTTGELSFYNNSAAVIAGLNGADFRDGAFHEYEVIKFLDSGDGMMKVEVFVDSISQGAPLLYSSFPNDVNGLQGFGFFSSSASTSQLRIDEFNFTPVPEPSEWFILACCGLAFVVGRNRAICPNE